MIKRRFPGLGYTLCCIITWATISHAAVRSGIFVYQFPTEKSIEGVPIDFSVAQEFTVMDTMTPGIAPDEFTDIIFKKDSIVASEGMVVASNPGFYDKYIKGKNLGYDDTRFYLDSMARKETLKTNSFLIAKAFEPAVHIRDTLYLIKTRENTFAALIKINEYIGGIDRYYYYWIYQDSPADDKLYKDNILIVPDSIRIGLSIFSGRPDPVFAIKDSDFANKLIRGMRTRVSKHFNPGVEFFVAPPPSSVLGYRGISVSGFDAQVNSTYPCFELYDSILVYYRMIPLIDSRHPVYAKDTSEILARSIIKYGIEHDLRTTDMYGELRFRDLIPDSIQNSIETQNGHTLWSALFSLPDPVATKGRNFSGTEKHNRIYLTKEKLIVKSNPGQIVLDISDITGKTLYHHEAYSHGIYSYIVDNKLSSQTIIVKCRVTLHNGKSSLICSRRTNIR